MIKIARASPADFPDTDNIFQTFLWGKIKQQSGQIPHYFWVTAQYENDENSESKNHPLVFPLMVTERRTSGGIIYAYAQRSPAVNIGEEFRSLLLEDIAESLTEFLPKETAFIRFDLPWPHFEKKTEVLRTELLELSMNFGTQTHNLRKAQKNYLCPNTIIIDLRFAPEKLLSSMRQQTRNSVRRAYREEVEFSIHDSESPKLEEELSAWYKIYTATAERKGFFYEKPEYFKMIFRTCRNWNTVATSAQADSLIPMDAQVPRPKFYLFTAHKNDTLLSGLILAVCGKTAYYMYAASSLEGWECMPNYGLQWEVMRFARTLGCTQYDLMGIPPNSNGENKMAGLYIFKTGFGGRKVRYGGTWDFPYNEKKYRNYRICEISKI